MVYLFKGKVKDLLNDLNNKQTDVPCETLVLEKIGNLLQSLGAKNVEIYKDLEGKTRLKYSLENKTFIISIDELYLEFNT